MDKVALIARLKRGAEPRAAELIRGGPPFDPATVGFERHTVYLSATEVMFVFEGREVAWVIDKLVGDPFQWVLTDALEEWKKIVEGSPRIARALYTWEQDRPKEDPR